jgi:hypothetical protein
MEDKKVNQKYLYNGKRIKLIESTVTDIGFDPDNPIVIYDAKIKSEVGSGKQLADGSYLGFVACGMHALDVRGASLRDFAASVYSAVLESEKY